MTKRVWMVLGLVLLLSLAMGGVAMAQGPEATADAAGPAADADAAANPLGASGLHLPPGGWRIFDVVAETLNMTPTELFEALHGGQTLSQIAEAQGVEMSEIRDAVKAAQKRIAREAILKALEEGKITREHANWMLKGVDNGWRFPPRRFVERGPGERP